MGFVNNVQCGAQSVAAGNANFRRIGMGSPTVSSNIEANRQIKVRTPGTSSRLYINVLTNDRGASTFRSRKNAANGNQVANITASTTGEFEDTTNTDSWADGDDVNNQLTTGAGGTTFTFNLTRSVFKSSGEHTEIFSSSGTAVAAVNDFSPLGGPGGAGTEANNQMKIQAPGTFKKLAYYVSANTRDANITGRLRVNGANVNLSVTITSATTGLFEDTANTDAVVVNDLVNHIYVTAGTAGTVTIQTAKIECSQINSSFQITGNDSLITAASTTAYFTLGGQVVSSATESDVVGDSAISMKLSKLGISVNTNTITGNSTFRLRKNGADGNQTVTITGLGTGHFMDSTNVDSVKNGDSLNYQMVAGAGGVQMNTRTLEMLASSGSIKDVIGCGVIPYLR